MIIIIVLIIAGLVLGFYYFTEIKDSGKESSSQTRSSGSGSDSSTYRVQQFQFGIADEEDYVNFENIIENNEMIQSLPDSGVLLLSFYNFYTGERTWEKSYILTKGNAEEGSTDDYDIKMIMASKYLTVLNENNLCDVIKTAKANGDFASQTEKSTLSLGWKYKGMFEYKDCLGL